MPELTAPTADVLVIAMTGATVPTGSGGYENVVLRSLRTELSVSGSAISHSGLANDVLPDLRMHKLFLEDRDRFWRLHPPLNQRGGAFVTGAFQQVTVSGRNVLLFSSDLRLNTDGPSMPVLRLAANLLQQVKPSLVLFAGLGAGVLPEHQVGDVALSASGTLALRGELEGTSLNDRTYGNAWTPDSALVEGLVFAPLQEPGLLAPSPHYGNEPASRPPVHQPQARVERLPVMTRPRVTDDLFEIPSPYATDQGLYWGDKACAVDMDAAAVAAACGEYIRCGLVIGLAVPGIRRFEYDYESSLRRAWAEHFLHSFADDAARNVALVVRRLIERA